MRTDWENLEDGDSIMIYPNEDNPLIRKQAEVYFASGYFYVKGPKKWGEGPDFYFGDVARYNVGFDLIEP